jgi:hypothetical protein
VGATVLFIGFSRGNRMFGMKNFGWILKNCSKREVFSLGEAEGEGLLEESWTCLRFFMLLGDEL